MRALLVAAGLALLALPALPPAQACHPALGLAVPVPGVATVGVVYDHGCPHTPVPDLCVTIEWQAIPAPPTRACAPA